MSGLLLKIVSVFLFIVAYETAVVSAAVWGSCMGRRLDTLAQNQYMTPSKCISLGGTCCGLDPNRDMMSEDPTQMLDGSSGFTNCYTCYDSNANVACSGDLVRQEPYNWYDPGNAGWITADKCVAAGGNCCKKSATYIFNPNYLKDPNCNDCYSGELSGFSCGGKLLLTNYNFTAKSCADFGGSCCDTYYGQGRTAFCAKSYPNPELLTCDFCYSGSAQIVG